MEEDIETKQNYLREEIIDKGYNPENFTDFVSTLRDDGTFDLESWSMNDLIQIVNYYKEQSQKAAEGNQSNDTKPTNYSPQENNEQTAPIESNDTETQEPHQQGKSVHKEHLQKDNELTDLSKSEVSKSDSGVKSPSTSISLGSGTTLPFE